MNLAYKYDFKIDIHGLPGMIPAFSCMGKDFIADVDWNRLSNVLQPNVPVTRISTHIGLEHKDVFSNYSLEEVKQKWMSNYQNLKNHMEEVLDRNIEIGLENIPGGFKYDEKSLTPEYVSENWNMADFGVFDITHAKLASKTLKIDFDEYLNRLNYKDKVRIFHISGNNDETGIYNEKPDKHVLLSQEEIDDIVKCKNLFSNLDLIVSEYSFESVYSIQKEIIIEAVAVNCIANDIEPQKIKEYIGYLRSELQDDICNVDEVLTNINL